MPDEQVAPPPGPPLRITILGLGNTLFSDEGVGVHALPLLREALRDVPGIEFIEGGTDGLRLLGPVEAAEALIVIDAVDANQPPGTVLVLEAEDIPAVMTPKLSVHQVAFSEVLFLTKLRGTTPRRLKMVGVQPQSLEMGLALSDTVRERLGDVIAAVRRIIDEWMDEHEST
ncbi:MAG TPA: HyaD/HybD family hydrogenase maturation endopeptidase [Thermaerobacter sp.]